MSLLQKIRFWFTPKKSATSGNATYSNLAPIDVEAIALRYQLREDGERLGKGGVPGLDSVEPVGSEALAIAEVETARLAYQQWASHRLNAIDNRIDACDIRHPINEALIADETFIASAAALLTQQQHALDQLATKTKERRTELEQFKAQNQITKSAVGPSSSERLLMHALLSAILIIESFFNAKFFQDGLAGGFLDGVTNAALFAAINLIPAYLIGRYQLPEKNHISTSRKLRGWLFAGIWLVFAFALALIVAHFRNALVLQSDDPGAEALKTLMETPLSMGNIPSVILFAMSFFFSLIALIEGYKMADPYPGFSAISERFETVQHDYELELNQVLIALQEHKKTAIENLNKVINSTQGITAALAGLINDKESAAQRVSATMNYSQAAAGALAQIFRASNSLARRPEADPKYFSRAPVLLPIDVPSFDTAKSIALLDEQSALVTKLIGEAQGITKRISAAFNRNYASLKPLDEQFGKEQP